MSKMEVTKEISSTDSSKKIKIHAIMTVVAVIEKVSSKKMMKVQMMINQQFFMVKTTLQLLWRVIR